MLMRMFDAPDFERTLRRRRLAAFGLLTVGLAGILCYLYLLHDNDTFPEFTRGFYLGGACGITIGAVMLLARVTYLLSHLEARKKARIQERDEGERAIVSQSFQFAGIFTFFAAVASMFVLVAVNMSAASAVFGVVVVYAVTWLLANLFLSRRL